MSGNTPPTCLPGDKFNRLTVICEDGKCSRNKNRRYLCRCDCGRQTHAVSWWLTSGAKKSCGCINPVRTARILGRPARVRFPRDEGGRRARRRWGSMMKRCYDKNSPNYKWYGGRGIKVCDRWFVFDNFLADMGPPPSKMSIDRINVDGNYEPANCKWATDKEQSRNKRNSSYVEYKGQRMNMVDAAAMAGLNPDLLSRRIRSGWSVEKAMTEPVRKSVRL